MSSPSVTMADTLVSARLNAVGLPSMAHVAAQQGNPPATDPYAAPVSVVAQLSGYGQLLSATSSAETGLESLLGSATNHASISAAGVLTANATNEAALGAYTVAVSQLAQTQTLTSTLVVADPTASLFAPGSFTLTRGSGETAQATTVNVTGSSLNDLVSALNLVGAGVTASVVSGTYGASLQVSSTQTGAANAFTLSGTTGNPFNQWGTFLSQLGLQQTQAAQDAAFTINGVAGTSATNTGVALDVAGAATVNLLAAGSSTVTVNAAATIPADLTSVSTAATQLVQNYNAFMGTAVQLTATGGALDGNTLAEQLKSDLYQATQATYTIAGSSLTALSELGLTTSGPTGAMTLNTSTLNAAFAGDGAGAAALMTSITSALHAVLTGYASNTGSIVSQVTATESGMAFINGQAASAYPTLSGTVKQHLLQWSLASLDAPPALPGISIFA